MPIDNSFLPLFVFCFDSKSWKRLNDAESQTEAYEREKTDRKQEKRGIIFSCLIPSRKFNQDRYPFYFYNL